MSAQEGELAAVDPAALSPREFVVFQYSLSILQFLTLHIKVSVKNTKKSSKFTPKYPSASRLQS